VAARPSRSYIERALGEGTPPRSRTGSSVPSQRVISRCR
jgi:hypothetical protein